MSSPTIGSLYDAKENAFAFQPLLLVTITQNDGMTLNLCTHDLTIGGENHVTLQGQMFNSSSGFPATFNAPISYPVTGPKINGVVINNVEYLPRITNQDIAATQALSEDGIDITPTVTLRIADPDQELFTNFELDAIFGFKGAIMTLTLILADMAGFTVDGGTGLAIFAPSYSTDSLGCFIGQCNPATQDNDHELIVSAVSKLNMKRILLPTVAVQKRCPWILPLRYSSESTDIDGNLVSTITDQWAGTLTVTTISGTTTSPLPGGGASDPLSKLYFCGFDNGATRGNNVFPTDLTYAQWTNPTVAGYVGGPTVANSIGPFHCQYTKQGCIALGMYLQDDFGRHTGGFGGEQYDLAANNLMDWSGKSFIEGVNMEGVGSRALGKYNDYVPLVYGTAWVECVVMNVAGDPNSTRGEAVCCSEEVGNVITVMVDDIMCPPGSYRYTGNTTGPSDAETAILASVGQALDNPAYLDNTTVGISYVWNTTPIIVDLVTPSRLTTGDWVYVYGVGGYAPPTNSFIGAVFGTNQIVPNAANGLWTIIVDESSGGLTSRVALIGSSGNMTYNPSRGAGTLTTNVNSSPGGPYAAGMNATILKTFRWSPINYGVRTGQPCMDAPFNGSGDPYGSLCAVEWVVPIAVAQSNVVPNVRALIDGPKLPVFTTNAGGGTGLDGNPIPGYDGTNASLLNAYAKMGSPYNGNPVWQILDVLTRCAWTYDQIDLKSFIDAAAVCQQLIGYTDQFGVRQQHQRYSCSFTISRRKPAADVLRSLRMACNAILLPGANGLLQIRIKQDIGSQQPGPMLGSNNNDAVPVNIPAQFLNPGAPSQGYLAYDFTESDILRNGDKTTFKIHQLPIQQAPNKIQVSFQDKENAYQQDGLTIVDDYDYNNVGEVDTQLQMEGPNTMDHIQRIVTCMLAEYHKGNPSAQSHGTLQITFDTTYRASHLKIGDIVRLTFAQRGITKQLCRVMSIAPTQNFEGLRIMMQWHHDVWYCDAFGQGLLQDSGSLGGNSVNRPPFPWQPWMEQPNSQDPLEGPVPKTDWNFAVTQSYVKNADLSQTALINITGVTPINQFSQKVRRPIVPPQGSFSTSGGTFIGPATYYVMLCAIDINGKYSAPSLPISIDVTQTTSSASLSFRHVICDPQLTDSQGHITGGTVQVAIFSGASQQTMTFNQIVPVGGGTSVANFSGTVSDFEERTWGVPDVALNSITLKAKQIIHGGVFGVAISRVNSGTITVLGAGWTSNQWAGRQCTVVSDVANNGGNPLPIWNFTVTSNTADTLTVTPDPTSDHMPGEDSIQPGDALIMRFKVQVTPLAPADGATGNSAPSQTQIITDPSIINSLNGFGEVFDVVNVEDNGDGTSTVFTDEPSGFDGMHQIYIEEVTGAIEVNDRWGGTSGNAAITIVGDPATATSFIVHTTSSRYVGGGTCAQQIPGLIPSTTDSSGNPGGPEVGKIFRVIGGAGVGATAAVASNTATSWTLAQPLAAGVDGTSIFIIEENAWRFTQNSGVIKNSTPPTLDGTTVNPAASLLNFNMPVTNLEGDTLLVMGVAEDVNGNEAPESTCPFREVYMIGAPGPTFIRDWLAKFIVGDDPMAVGTDVMVNHYRVRCNAGEWVQLLDTAIQAKDAPVGSDAIFDIKYSTDGGTVWTTIFTSTIHLAAGKLAAQFDVSQFAVTKLYRDWLLRFDITQVGSSTPGGSLEVDLKGKVFA